MKQKASYGVLIKDLFGTLFPHLQRTCERYANCLADITVIVLEHWDEIDRLSDAKSKHNAVEHLIHTTKTNQAVYPQWDKNYSNYPSYMRRATIMDALGHVQSYKSNHANWESQGKQGREPSLGNVKHPSPTFYNDNMFKWDGKSTHAQIKLLKQNGKWDWFSIDLAKTDVDYITKHCANRTRSAPTLVRRGKEYELVFLWTMPVELSDTPVESRRICVVDLGVNTAAGAMIMDARGNRLARRMFKYEQDERKLSHALNIIKKRQSHGSKDLTPSWKNARDVNRHIAESTVNDIVDFAIEYSADVIVFEYLDMKGKIKGKSKRQRLSIWRYRQVQTGAEQKAHDWGMRISRVSPWKSSVLAFNGSGECMRGSKIEDKDCRHGYGVVRFPDGTLYSSEYNATSNLGARYFLRELMKVLPKRRRQAMIKKMPQLEHPGSCVLADLWQFWAVFDKMEKDAEKRRKGRKKTE